MSPYKSKDFKTLQSKWYAKLKKSGFNDIETPDGELKTSQTDYFKFRHKLHGSLYFETREEYYSLARSFLQTNKFDSTKSKIIWGLHSEGISVRDIVKHLNKAGFVTERGVPVHRRYVHEAIQRLAKQMSVKIGDKNE